METSGVRVTLVKIETRIKQSAQCLLFSRNWLCQVGRCTYVALSRFQLEMEISRQRYFLIRYLYIARIYARIHQLERGVRSRVVRRYEQCL